MGRPRKLSKSQLIHWAPADHALMKDAARAAELPAAEFVRRAALARARRILRAAQRGPIAEFAGSQQETAERTPCPAGDPLCPCQDGDACHYEPSGKTRAWTKPADSLAEAQRAPADPATVARAADRIRDAIERRRREEQA